MDVVAPTGVDPWVDRGKFFSTFEVEGTLCVLSPYFFGVRHFVLMRMVFIG